MRRDDASDAGLTYPEVGATRDDQMPPGYGHVERDVVIGSGRAVFERAAEALFSWQMHRGTGLGVRSTAARAATGVVVTLRAGFLTIPCRVVYTVETGDRRGFAYGTLPGHPERGEEAFLIELTEAGDVRVRIRAFSRPATLLARAGGPLTRRFQEFVTDRYVTALRKASGRAAGSNEDPAAPPPTR
ncbi:uncharacterized protein (UPF0548 family) [Actinoplanes lutulentus]|uniref:Uncharacterized protein (UPF0548 family) n=1 Tax=Actinoplanes lutulentus TaxID=1287878 RepID=A0A327YXF3_9ACTN|nr:DUF1990 domain-containing protein [Actinoplanes lutulentus]MBB2947537.1 uncharacterized protein (UPF0548 family) [Actinoplanes lutulentus]RAK25693.1 uncharacterized protein (UPF0548 family) [Actinoplanes lutulentus]